MIVEYLNLRARESHAVPGSAPPSHARGVRFPILAP
jgi:hypothetical protein